MPKNAAPSCRVGLVLGSGAARGWAHLGVIEGLEALGIRPNVVAGCSIGALVGAVYAAGRLDELKSFALGLDTLRMIRYFDVNFSGGGMIAGRNLAALYRKLVGQLTIEDLDLPFMAVATDIRLGREIWLKEGDLALAISASTAIPGLVRPVKWRHRWLADGALVNPVPVSLARALDADIVIAVDVNSDVFGPALRRSVPPITLEGEGPETLEPADSDPDRLPWSWLDDLSKHLPPGAKRSASRFVRSLTDPRDQGPQHLEVMNNALAIMSDRITRSRAVGEPPDIMLSPSLAHIGVLEFDKAQAGIDAGRKAVEVMREPICALFGIDRHGIDPHGGEASVPGDRYRA